MMSRCGILLGMSLLFVEPLESFAQPSRQMPGSRPFLAGMLQNQPPARNSRVRTAASQVGLESTDFYIKNGYPKVLGDAVEAGNSTSSGAGGAANMGGAGGNTGNTGVQSAGSGGFQGNTGNQIGQMSGGTILGGLFGFSQNTGAGNRGTTNGFTGGGFTGLVPKGFGFGGTSLENRLWASPLNGTLGR